MAFKLFTADVGQTPPLESVPADTSTTYAVGMALKIASGKAALASGTDVPVYICQTAGTGLSTIQAIRVLKSQKFNTVFSATPTSIVPGSKVTIATDGLRVTATTTDGIAEVISLDGTTSGSAVKVRF